MTTQTESIRIFLCGDVMTGRGIDQVLPNPGPRVLYEPLVHDAREYIRLAEYMNGRIARPMKYAAIWGNALAEMDRIGTDVRIVNLETGITTADQPWPGKDIHYRMNPLNIGCLTTAQIDCCCLANNHVLDWGRSGLTETLHTLDRAGIARSGAGENAVEAQSPALIDVPNKGRIRVFSMGSATSGIPWTWKATGNESGVDLLQDLTEVTATRVADRIQRSKQPDDVTIASIHWGGNWGYDIPDEQVRFAHLLVEGGVDIVHGHSSHHVKAIEIYKDRLILYGCGDFIDDYEGITGYEAYRDDLRLMYIVRCDPHTGRFLDAQLVPLRVSRFRLTRASHSDTMWLIDLLRRLSAPFGTPVALLADHTMLVRTG